MRFLLDSQTGASTVDGGKDTILSQKVSGELISSVTCEECAWEVSWSSHEELSQERQLSTLCFQPSPSLPLVMSQRTAKGPVLMTSLITN